MRTERRSMSREAQAVYFRRNKHSVKKHNTGNSVLEINKTMDGEKQEAS